MILLAIAQCQLALGHTDTSLRLLSLLVDTLRHGSDIEAQGLVLASRAAAYQALGLQRQCKADLELSLQVMVAFLHLHCLYT